MQKFGILEIETLNLEFKKKIWRWKELWTWII